MTSNRKPTLRPAFDLYQLLLWGAILLYVLSFTRLAFALHLGMRTHRSDLGQIAQAVWNSSRGRFVEMTDNGFVATRLTDHVEPILALISPVLWLWADVRALLLLQVVGVAIGAWLLYTLALQRLEALLSARERTQIWIVEPLRQLTRPLAFGVALAYLFTPQLQSAVLTEFHAAPLAVPLILWAFWSVEKRRYCQFGLATLLVATVKEEMALLAAALGCWLLWRLWLTRREQPAASPTPRWGSAWLWRVAPYGLGVGIIVGSALWFYLATFVIVPAHAIQVYASAESVYFNRYGALGDSPADIVLSFVRRPYLVWQVATEAVRLRYLWALLAPFGLLSLLAPEILLLALPLLLANLLSAYPAQYYGDFHYSAPLVPYVAVAAVYGLARLWHWIDRLTAHSSASYQHLPAAAAGTMALAALWTNARTALRPLLALSLTLWLLCWATAVYRAEGRGPWGGGYDPPAITMHHHLLPYFVGQIPPAAAVTATAAVHPHVSLRRYVYQFPLGLPELGIAGYADWALLDVTTNTDMAPGDLKAAVDALLQGEWGVVDGADGFLLLHRGAREKRIPTAFYDFARADPAPPPASAMTAPPALPQLVQVTVDDWPRWRQTKVVSDWQVGSGSPAGFTPALTLVTPSGEQIRTLAEGAPPALVWYDPVQWQGGEMVRVTTLPLVLPLLWGVVTDPAMATRLPADIVSADGTQQLVGRFQRTASGVSAVADPDPAIAPPLSAHRATLRTVTGAQLQGRAWVATATVAPGETVLLRLQWFDLAQWPAGYQVFVHLRQGDTNLTQQDGPPRYFVTYDPAVELARHGLLEDARALVIPAALPVGTTLQLVVGLYNPSSGERAAVVDSTGAVIANEWTAATLTVGAPPLPDQACALIPATCAAQPHP